MTKKTVTKIGIEPVNQQIAEITLIGDSDLIINRWSEKAKKEMLDKQMGKAHKKKAAKDPKEDYNQARYKLSEKSDGIPAVAFKLAAVGACRFTSAKMTEARGAFHVVGEFVEIHGERYMREDMVRIGQGVADIRYRPGYKDWWVKLTIRYNADFWNLEQLTNLFNQAGFGVGVGEWRAEKDGAFGLFHVASDREAEKLAA